MLAIIRSGLAAANHQISAISNNLANAGTTGFKRSSAMFADVAAPALGSIPETNTGSGTRMTGSRQSFSQGAFRTTGQVLDMAIKGDSFFVQRGKTGEPGLLFTRDGSMQLDRAGRIVSNEGRLLLGRDGNPIAVPMAIRGANGEDVFATEVTISKKGEVSVSYGVGTILQAGQISLARFSNNEGLRPRGQGLFTASEQSGPPVIGTPGSGLFGEIFAGSLEASNADVSAELVALISAQQAFTGNSRLMQTDVEIVRRFTQ